MSDSDRGVERREFLRRVTIVAGTAPVIVTVLSSSAQAALSCSPAGTICGSALAGCTPPALPCCSPTTCFENPGGPGGEFCSCH